jgi:hypothetical protein
MLIQPFMGPTNSYPINTRKTMKGKPGQKFPEKDGEE